MANKVSQLHTIYYYASGSCNLRCRHCWIEPGFSDAAAADSYTPFALLRPVFEEAKTLGLCSVKLTGGEPFLYPEIDDIIESLINMKLRVTIETNGTLLNPQRVESLAGHGIFVAVSLDGAAKATHESLRGVEGCYDKLLQNMALMQKAGIRYQVIFSLHKKNAGELADAIKLAISMGAGSFKINPINDLGRADKMKSNSELHSVAETLAFYNGEFAEIVKDCPIPVHFDIPAALKSLTDLRKQSMGVCGIMGILGLLHDGSAGLCGIGEKIPEMNFGSVLNGGLTKIWQENKFLQQIREGFPRNLQGVCGRCRMKMHCGGKCLASTFAATGSLVAGFPFCEEALRSGLFPQTRLNKSGSNI
ncbi:MAG: radical SAM protein [Candidatus Riflebacteria bacterium]|nr:radical SAM protein [Candidatus Riflebacteria bacterium]